MIWEGGLLEIYREIVLVSKLIMVEGVHGSAAVADVRSQVSHCDPSTPTGRPPRQIRQRLGKRPNCIDPLSEVG